MHAVRYSPCRLQLAVYQVVNINLLYIFRARNIAVFYNNLVMEAGRDKLLVTSHGFAIEQDIPGNDLYFDG